MLTLQECRLSDEAPCPYLPDRTARYEYFFALDLDARELDALIATGWRKFGLYFFRPECPGCRSCVPLRVPVAGFRPSKGQRRVMRKNIRQTRLGVRYRPEIFSIYGEQQGPFRKGRPNRGFHEFLGILPGPAVRILWDGRHGGRFSPVERWALQRLFHSGPNSRATARASTSSGN